MAYLATLLDTAHLDVADHLTMEYVDFYCHKSS